jgi:HPt (histidine-containing phosphotransfer) domain-containing protein
MPTTLPVTPELPATDPLSGDPEFRVVLATLFLDDYARQLERIRQAINDRDALLLRSEAHSLKGSTGVFRHQGAFGAAFQMEMIGRDAAWDRVESQWEVLQAETTHLARSLAEIVAASPALVGAT